MLIVIWVIQLCYWVHAKCIHIFVRYTTQVLGQSHDCPDDSQIILLGILDTMYYYVHMFGRLRKIIPSQLLLNIYKSYVQSKIDYGLTIWGCTTEANLDRIQRIQNLLARIMCNNFDYINFCGIEMVQTLRL